MHDDFYQLWACEFVEEEYEMFEKITGSVLRNPRDERIPEIISDILLRNMANVMRTWDDTKGPIEKHVRVAYKRYVWKWLYRWERQHRVETLWNDAIGDDAATEHTPETSLVAQELAEAVAALETPLRLVVQYHYFDDLSVAEIADKMCLNRGTIYQRLRKAETELREVFVTHKD